MPSANKAIELIDSSLAARFRGDVARLVDRGDARIGLAVSGGPDSLAMLLLAAAIDPERFEAATVDHGLRPEAAAEATLVARHCARLGITHAILEVDVAKVASIQAAARSARYDALTDWCRRRSLPVLMTAHHADDQAETLLMRLARGAGQTGLAGIRESRDQDGIHLVRPLLGWRRQELAALAIGLDSVVEDSSNVDPRFDRVRMRQLLASTDIFDPLRIQAAARHLAEADDALDWVVREAIRSRCTLFDDGRIEADLGGLPRELRRRIVSALVARCESAPDGPTLDRALERIEAGRNASVGGLKIVPGRRISIEKAPDRR